MPLSEENYDLIYTAITGVPAPSRRRKAAISQPQARKAKADLSAARKTIRELKEENKALRALLKKSL